MIKVHNNFDKQVFAYVRQSEDEIFLVILNFGGLLNSCQLLLPKEIFKQSNKFEIELENVLTTEKFRVRVFQGQRIKLKLDKETSYVLKIIKN